MTPLSTYVHDSVHVIGYRCVLYIDRCVEKKCCYSVLIAKQLPVIIRSVYVAL